MVRGPLDCIGNDDAARREACHIDFQIEKKVDIDDPVDTSTIGREFYFRAASPAQIDDEIGSRGTGLLDGTPSATEFMTPAPSW